MPEGLAQSLAGVGQQGYVAGALDFDCQFALALGAQAGLAARTNFAGFTDEPAEQFDIFVINVIALAGALHRGKEAPVFITRTRRNFVAHGLSSQDDRLVPGWLERKLVLFERMLFFRRVV